MIRRRVDREPALARSSAASVSRCICEKLVTTRNGMPRSWRLRIASTEPGQRLALEDDDAVGIEDQAAHAPERASRSRSRAIAPMVGCPATTRAEDRMGLLDGKTALIFGVANDHSIAWGIAQALHAEGAEVGFSSVESLIEKRVRPLAESIGSTFVEPCDVQSDEQIERVFARWARDARLARHPRPRPGLRQARGPRGRLRRHVARRVRARARRLGLLARGARRARRGRCSAAARRS